MIEKIRHAANYLRRKTSRDISAVQGVGANAPFRKDKSLMVPCHYSTLFVKSNGDVYPCCIVWNNENMKIGHITDKNIIARIKDFDGGGCKCQWHANRKSYPGEVPKIHHIHLELSLKCQADCVMCCVGSPGWVGTYDYYHHLTKILEEFRPQYVTVQGGEVLIQKASLSWVEAIKKAHPEIKFRLTTNGGAASNELIKIVEKLFTVVSVSFVGFQPDTYHKIMGLNVLNTKSFSEKLIDGNAVNMRLKFLVTPINIHEVGSFFRWAASVKPNFIVIHDCNINQYINYNTNDKYWEKIIHRSGESLRNEIIAVKNELEADKIKLNLSPAVKQMFCIDNEFLTVEKLNQLFVSDMIDNYE